MNLAFAQRGVVCERMPTPSVLLLIPPLTQLNTPYPSTAYLTGFLRSRGITAVQEDLALALVLDLLSPAGLDQVRERAGAARGAALRTGRRLPRGLRPLPLDHRPHHPLPARARLHARAPHRRPRLVARGHALRLARRLRRRRGRRPARLGLRRARPAGPRPPPRHALPERP